MSNNIADENIVIRMHNISKHFGGVYALRNVSFDLFKGEVLAVLGDNGAGKSTLIKILAGAYMADSGEIFVNNKKVEIDTPNMAKKLQIETIYQDLSLMNNLDIASNIFMGREIKCRGLLGLFGQLNSKMMISESKKLLERFKIIVPDISRNVELLSGGQRQMVAISRAIYFNAQIIIMDEPTAALGVSETEKVYSFIKELQSQGISIIIISHNIDEVYELSGRFMIMKNGQMIGIKEKSKTNPKEIVKMIISGKYE